MKATVHGAATVEAASRRFVPRIEPQDDRSNAARRRVLLARERLRKVALRVRVLIGRQIERVAAVAIRNCPTREELSSYIQGGLPEELTEAVAEHVETCVICDATLDALERQGDPLFRGLRHPAPPPSELDSPEFQRAMKAAEAAGLDGGDFRNAAGCYALVVRVGTPGRVRVARETGQGRHGNRLQGPANSPR